MYHEILFLNAFIQLPETIETEILDVGGRNG